MEGIYFFGEHVRWNLGWNNPNPAGLFVAMWIPWMWGLGAWVAGGKDLGARRSWHGLRPDAAVTLVLAVELGLWFLLCKTYSRGALVAVVGSGVVFLGWRYAIGGMSGRWGWLAARLAGVVLLLLLTGFFSRIDPRFVSQDASAGNRLMLWKGGLQMVAASPWDGWGAGNSGPAFMNWFQAQKANEQYAGMVNSYLHVGVERGLPLLTAVITSGMGLMAMAWQTSRALRGRAGVNVAAAGCSWLVFLIANGFSTLWIFKNLWWLPGFAALWIMGSVLAAQREAVLGITGRSLGLSAVFSVCVAALMWVAGHMMAADIRISPGSGDGWILCGDGTKNSRLEVMLFPDPSVLGETWGKEVRLLAGELNQSRIRVATAGRTNIPIDARFCPRWIIACGGEVEEGFSALGEFPEAHLILVHPLGRPSVPEEFRGKVTVILPMLDTRGTGRQWKMICKRLGWEFRTSPGVGQDVRLAWPEVLMKEM